MSTRKIPSKIPSTSTIKSKFSADNDTRVSEEFTRSGTYVVEESSTPNKPEITQASKKLTLAEIKQQKRAELMKAKNHGQSRRGEEGSINNDVYFNNANISTNTRNLEGIIRNSKQTGILNLSDYGLTEVPNSVWNINYLEDNESRSHNVSLENEKDDSKWWTQVELTKMILADNKIRHIPRDIERLATLVTLDVPKLHDNQIESIDEAIGHLTVLQSLNISHNKLNDLPNNITTLKNLKNLNVSFNNLTQLPKNLGKLDEMEKLNVSNNKLAANSLPKSFSWMKKLQVLNLSTNSLAHVIPEIFFSPHLKFLDLSENTIEHIPKEISFMPCVEQLYLRQNNIKQLPVLERCHKLKDWDISFNKIVKIEENSFDNLSYLTNFNLRDNCLEVLPKSIKNLHALERLDVTNNNLPNLPYELATIESLKQILVVGNPLRSIRRDIVNRGSDAIIKHLRNHLEELADKNSQDVSLRDIVKSTKICDLSCKKLNNLTLPMIDICRQSTAVSLNLTKNLLVDLPHEFSVLNNQLNELNLSFNMFSTLPKPMLDLTHLACLDLRANKFTHVSTEISRLKSLRELILADNKITEFPDGIYDLPILENLFINNNRIQTIDPLKIVNMKHLATINLQNNDISRIPNELGRATQLRSLLLEGNVFRVPTPQVLAKGTAAILEYLRCRLQ